MEKEDLIHGYFAQTLNAAEQKRFEQLINEDPDFAEEVAFRTELRTAITVSEREKMKGKLQEMEATFPSDRKKELRGYRMVVAATVVLFIFSVVSIYRNIPPSSSELYEQYYSSFPNVVKPIVRGEIAADEQAKAYQYYEQGDYQQALALFSTAQDEEARFYSGLCELALENYEDAVIHFDKTITHAGTLKWYAMWYKSLALIQLEDKEQAEQVLAKLIENPDFGLRDKAIALKTELAYLKLPRTGLGRF